MTPAAPGYRGGVSVAPSSLTRSRRPPRRPVARHDESLRLLPIPGVFQPRSDTWMLIDAVRSLGLAPGARVLDLCTGSGAIAVAAAMCGASVTAVDVSRRAQLSARVNAIANGVRVRAVRGDLFDAVRGERFDLIVSNPPYLPAADDELPQRGETRAWDAGRDGRALLDPLCARAAEHLAPGGTILIIHSSVSDLDATMRGLSATGLAVDVLFEHEGAFGPLVRERIDRLCDAGLLERGSDTERVAIIRGVARD